MDYDYVEKLVRNIKDGNEQDLYLLFNEFKPYILSYCRRIYLHQYDIDDLENECYITLLNAIKIYDISKNRFVSYGISAIKNKLKFLLRESKRSIPPDDIIYNFNEEIDIIDVNKLSTEEAYLFKEKLNEIKLTLCSKSPEYYYMYKEVIINKNTLTSYSQKYNINYSKAYRIKKEIIDILNSTLI